MSAGRLFVAILTVFAVGAAVVYSANVRRSRIENARVESNRLIAASEALKRELHEKFGLTLTPLLDTVPASTRAREFAWAKFSLAQRRVILAKLFTHVNTVERIFEITAQDGLHLEGGADQLKKSANAAWTFYLAGKSFRG